MEKHIEDLGKKKRVAEKQYRREDIDDAEEDVQDEVGTFSKANEDTMAKRRVVKVRRGKSETLIPENFYTEEVNKAVIDAPKLNIATSSPKKTIENGTVTETSTKSSKSPQENRKTETVETEKSRENGNGNGNANVTSNTEEKKSPIKATFNWGGFNSESNGRPSTENTTPLSFASVSTSTPNSIFNFSFNPTPTSSSSSNTSNSNSNTDDLSSEYVPITPKVNLPPAEPVLTGEEEERTEFSTKAKLYEFDTQTKQFKERGVGQIKLNTSSTDTTKSARLVMRTEGTHRLILNNRIWSNSKIERHTNDKQVRFMGVNFETNQPTQFVLRVDRPETAEELIRSVENQKNKVTASNVENSRSLPTTTTTSSESEKEPKRYDR